MARPARIIVTHPAQWIQPQVCLSAQAEGLDTIAIGPHLFPEVWEPLDWVAPVQADGLQCVQHHPDCTQEHHPYCGPILFCCLKAFDLYRRYYPDSGVAQANWKLANPAELNVWLEQGTHVFHFAFCDPRRAEGLFVWGLEGVLLQDVLHKRVPIEAYHRQADRVG